jgi:hypothetical protein
MLDHAKRETTMSATICIIIDQSGSMGAYGYLAPAQTDAATFVNIMNTGDSVGVVAFSDNASVVFGSATSPTLITSQSVQNSAVTAIMGLTSLNMTNMVAAFNTAAGMLANSSGNIGEVFLSDGMYNTGGDPVPGLATSPPIYTIALGPNGQQSTLQAIATKTGGWYNYAPNALQLAAIYNAIINQSSVASLVANQQPTVGSYKFVSTPGVIPSGATQASFALNWDNPSVVYTPNTPTGNQVNVFLTDPNGNPVNTQATATGAGFVVFKIPSPIAGTYNATAWYTGPGSLAYTAGIFDNSNLSLALAAPQEVLRSGSALETEVRLADGDEPLDGARLSVSLESPRVTLDEALSTHAARLNRVQIADDVPEEHAPVARLTRLLQQSGEDLMPRQERPVIATAAGNGVYRIQVPNVEKAGSHTLHVTAHGVSPRTNAPYQRSSRVSFVVE